MWRKLLRVFGSNLFGSYAEKTDRFSLASSRREDSGSLWAGNVLLFFSIGLSGCSTIYKYVFVQYMDGESLIGSVGEMVECAYL